MTRATEATTGGAREDRCAGSLLGLALGDALGSRNEGSRGGAWTPPDPHTVDVLGWTDDTAMAVGLTEVLVERRGFDADAVALRWGEHFRREPWRGYGGGARALLDRLAAGEDWRVANRSVFPDGSFGNGAAMRAAPLGLCYAHDPVRLAQVSRQAAEITHAHPLGIDGGVLIARAVALASLEQPAPSALLEALIPVVRTPEFLHRLALARDWLASPVSFDVVRAKLGRGVAAHESAVTAVYAACRFERDYLGMIRWINELGGDTDTIGAMAGAICGARYGTAALPPQYLARLEAHARIERLARDLAAVAV